MTTGTYDCDGVTKKNTKCKNLGVYVYTDKVYCYWHSPRLSIDCVVCLEPLFAPKKLACGHLFHQNCIRKWLRVRRHCPICRDNIWSFRNDKTSMTTIIASRPSETVIAVAARSFTCRIHAFVSTSCIHRWSAWVTIVSIKVTARFFNSSIDCRSSDM